MIIGLNHVAIAAQDFERSVRFYTDTLGFPTEKTFDLPHRGMKIVFVRAGNASIEIFGYTEGPIEPPPPTGERQAGMRHIALLVDDVEETYKKLKKRGVEFVREPRRGLATFKDPDGIVIELTEWL